MNTVNMVLICIVAFACASQVPTEQLLVAGDDGWDRRPQYPLIDHDGFRALCQRRCDDNPRSTNVYRHPCNFNASDVRAGDCIFISTMNFFTHPRYKITTRFLDHFFDELLSQLRVPVMLVTHDSDISLPYQPNGSFGLPPANYSRYLFDHPRILHWFTVNCRWSPSHLPKPTRLTCLPIGAQPRYAHFVNHGRLLQIRAQTSNETDEHRTITVYRSFNKGRANDRMKVGRFLAYEALDKVAGVQGPMRHGTTTNYETLVTRSKFVAAPEGHGIDTHRMYETLVLGAIPIIVNSSRSAATSLLEAYKDLPILVVDEWSDLISMNLSARFIEFHQHTHYNYKRLYISYWREKFDETQQLLYHRYNGYS